MQFHPSISHAKELVLPLLTAWYALSAAQQGVGREQRKKKCLENIHVSLGEMPRALAGVCFEIASAELSRTATHKAARDFKFEIFHEQKQQSEPLFFFIMQMFKYVTVKLRPSTKTSSA